MCAAAACQTSMGIPPTVRAPAASASSSSRVRRGLYTASKTAAQRFTASPSTGEASAWGYIPTGVALISRSKSPWAARLSKETMA